MRETFIKTVGYSDDFIKATKSGWGCGYVYIPSEHPILVQLINEHRDYFYLQPNNCEQEITLSQWDGEKDYYVIGFDTAHSYNNSTHDEAYVIAETEKIKALVDAYTIEDAHKEAINCIANLRMKLAKYIIHE
jgi:hypothetical protein